MLVNAFDVYEVTADHIMRNVVRADTDAVVLRKLGPHAGFLNSARPVEVAHGLAHVAKHFNASNDLALLVTQRRDRDLHRDAGTGLGMRKNQHWLLTCLTGYHRTMKGAAFPSTERMTVFVHVRENIVPATAPHHVIAPPNR